MLKEMRMIFSTASVLALGHMLILELLIMWLSLELMTLTVVKNFARWECCPSASSIQVQEDTRYVVGNSVDAHGWLALVWVVARCMIGRKCCPGLRLGLGD